MSCSLNPRCPIDFIMARSGLSGGSFSQGCVNSWGSSVIQGCLISSEIVSLYFRLAVSKSLIRSWSSLDRGEGTGYFPDPTYLCSSNKLAASNAILPVIIKYRTAPRVQTSILGHRMVCQGGAQVQMGKSHSDSSATLLASCGH